MAQGSNGLTITSQGRSPGAAEDSAHLEAGRQLDRLTPLLHELLDWHLVELTEDGAYALRPEVQERLLRLAPSAPRAEAKVYVGRRCQSCGVVAVTRMVDDRRLCTTCRDAAAASAADHDATVVELPEAPRPAKHDHRFRRHRTAS